MCFIYSFSRLDKKEKATIYLKNTNEKCFQYPVTVALSYERIKWNLERDSNIKPFIKKHNWKGMNYPAKIDDWKTFEKNNRIIALNILYIKVKKYVQLIFENITHSTRIKQIIL